MSKSVCGLLECSADIKREKRRIGERERTRQQLFFSLCAALTNTFQAECCFHGDEMPSWLLGEEEAEEEEVEAIGFFFQFFYRD